MLVVEKGFEISKILKSVVSSQAKYAECFSKFSALVVQWIECGSPKAEIRVRFSSGVPDGKGFSFPFFCLFTKISYFSKKYNICSVMLLLAF